MGNMIEIIKRMSTFDIEFALKYNENDYESYKKFITKNNAYDIFMFTEKQFKNLHKISKM